jgi:hypothetical protein
VSSTIDYRGDGQLQDPISEGSDADGQPSLKVPRWDGPRLDIPIPLQPLDTISPRTPPTSPSEDISEEISETLQLEERCTIKGLANMAKIVMDRWERRASGADTEIGSEDETQPGNVDIARSHSPHNGSEAETQPGNGDILPSHSPHSCASTQLEVSTSDSE